MWVRKEHLFEPLHFWVFLFGNVLEFPCTPVLDILLLAAHIGRLSLIPLFLVVPLHHILRKSAWEVNILGAEFLCIWPVFILPESVWIFVSCAQMCFFSYCAEYWSTPRPPSPFFFKIKKNFFFWLCWVFLALLRLSVIVVSVGYFSLQRTGFRGVAFSRCSTRAQRLLCDGFVVSRLVEASWTRDWTLSQVVLVVKNRLANAGNERDTSSIPGSRWSPGEGNGNPLHYSCLENPLDRGAWPATVHGVAVSWRLLSNRAQQCHQGSPQIYFLMDHF